MKEIEPYLEAGLPPFYDLIVMTNGPQVSKLMNSGYLTPLDHTRLTNFDRYASELVRDPVVGPGQPVLGRVAVGHHGHRLPTRGGAKRSDASPTSLADLFDPALEGRVGMMTDLQDLGSAALLSIGCRPAGVERAGLGEGGRRAARAARQRRRRRLLRPVVRARAAATATSGSARRGRVTSSSSSSSAGRSSSSFRRKARCSGPTTC